MISILASPIKLSELVMGFALVAIVLVVRFGPSAAILAFFTPFLLLPFSAVYYSVSVFPSLLQDITFILPTRHILEGTRRAITEGLIPYDSIIWATTLNVMLVVLSFLFLHWMLRLARNKVYLSRLVQD